MRQRKLHEAVKRGSQRETTTALAEGADVNGLSKASGYAALHDAAVKGHQNVLKVLLGAENVNVNIRGRHGFTPLHVAAWGERPTRDKEKTACMVTSLIDHNADVHSRNKHGVTPLHMAAKMPPYCVARVLIEWGASAEATDEQGRTPLHKVTAEAKPHSEAVRLLAENMSPTGINKAEFTRGNTALHYAARKGDSVAVRTLLAARADPHLRNKQGKTPLELAQEQVGTSPHDALVSCSLVCRLLKRAEEKDKRQEERDMKFVCASVVSSDHSPLAVTRGKRCHDSGLAPGQQGTAPSHTWSAKRIANKGTANKLGKKEKRGALAPLSQNSANVRSAVFGIGTAGPQRTRKKNQSAKVVPVQDSSVGQISINSQETEAQKGMPVSNEGASKEANEKQTKRTKSPRERNEKPSSAVACKYGAKCYRKNREHLRRYWHPEPPFPGAAIHDNKEKKEKRTNGRAILDTCITENNEKHCDNRFQADGSKVQGAPAYPREKASSACIGGKAFSIQSSETACTAALSGLEHLLGGLSLSERDAAALTAASEPLSLSFSAFCSMEVPARERGDGKEPEEEEEEEEETELYGFSSLVDSDRGANTDNGSQGKFNIPRMAVDSSAIAGLHLHEHLPLASQHTATTEEGEEECTHLLQQQKSCLRVPLSLSATRRRRLSDRDALLVARFCSGDREEETHCSASFRGVLSFDDTTSSAHSQQAQHYLQKHSRFAWEIDPAELALDTPRTLLGEGASGPVYSGRWLTHAALPVALKVLSVPASSDNRELVRVLREADALACLSSGHPCLVQCHGAAFVRNSTDKRSCGAGNVAEEEKKHAKEQKDTREVTHRGHDLVNADGQLGNINTAFPEPKMLLVMERATMNLAQWLSANGQTAGRSFVSRLPEVLKIAGEVSSALQHLHGGPGGLAPIVHRDLKLENVLLCSDGRAKLCDFGLAKSLKRATLGEDHIADITMRGTVPYLAPEVFREKSQNEKVDIYALGVILWELVAGKRAWENVEGVQVMFRVSVLHEKLPLEDVPCCKAHAAASGGGRPDLSSLESSFCMLSLSSAPLLSSPLAGKRGDSALEENKKEASKKTKSYPGRSAASKEAGSSGPLTSQCRCLVWPEDLKALVASCLSQEPSDRPPASQVTHRLGTFAKKLFKAAAEYQKHQRHPEVNELAAEIDWEELLFVSDAPIASGTQGEVYRARYRGHQVVVKIPKGYPKALKELAAEDRILKALAPHPNVVRYYGLSMKQKKPGEKQSIVAPSFSVFARMGVVLEYCGGGSLSSVLEQQAGKEHLSKGQKRLWALQCAAGLAHLHRAGILHRDIASRNVLLSSSGEAKITDFGYSRQCTSTVYKTASENVFGALAWMAPERMRGSTTVHSDIYSYGILLWEIMEESTDPFPHLRGAALSHAVVSGVRPVTTGRSSDMLRIMYKCWRDEPSCRFASFDEIQREIELLMSLSGHGPGDESSPTPGAEYEFVGL